MISKLVFDALMAGHNFWKFLPCDFMRYQIIGGKKPSLGRWRLMQNGNSGIM
jgi:hypothetical protein